VVERDGVEHDDLHASLERLRQISTELDAMRHTREQEREKIARLNREADLVRGMLDRPRKKWRPLL
jgi:hypothetical protein